VRDSELLLVLIDDARVVGFQGREFCGVILARAPEGHEENAEDPGGNPRAARCDEGWNHVILGGVMVELDLRLDGDGALKREFESALAVIHLTGPIIVTTLDGGMDTGRASVGLSFALPSGECVFAETSLRLFLLAAKMMAAKFPEQAADI